MKVLVLVLLFAAAVAVAADAVSESEINRDSYDFCNYDDALLRLAQLELNKATRKRDHLFYISIIASSAAVVILSLSVLYCCLSDAGNQALRKHMSNLIDFNYELELAWQKRVPLSEKNVELFREFYKSAREAVVHGSKFESRDEQEEEEVEDENRLVQELHDAVERVPERVMEKYEDLLKEEIASFCRFEEEKAYAKLLHCTPDEIRIIKECRLKLAGLENKLPDEGDEEEDDEDEEEEDDDDDDNEEEEEEKEDEDENSSELLLWNSKMDPEKLKRLMDDNRKKKANAKNEGSHGDEDEDSGNGDEDFE